MSRAAAVVQRLMAIDWRDEKRALAEADTRAVLLLEYFRRAANWVEWCGGTEGWPFVDLAESVDPTVAVPAEIAEPFEAYLYDNVGLFNASEMSRAAVRWAVLTEVSTVPRPPLEDPYEPLIRCFELGGGLATEGHWVDLWTMMIPKRKPADYAGPDRVTRLLDRLAAIRWNDDEAATRHEGSRAELFAEYLRRMGSWGLAHGAERPWPGLDPVECLDPSVRVAEGHAARLERIVEENALGPMTARFCRNAVRWAELGRWRALGAPDEDPFEPLLRCFERGGQFFTENRVALLGIGGGVPFRSVAEWAEQGASESLESLEPGYLDALDRA
ncbi:hypothetical protein ACIA8O_20020 [Kitasatospora sp. NPDC051853]|uniref:hypothetical protein n=1 Tax=Kitasatospora sp. NPDC051853 TaxID=3364058 RepID=UPI0037972477